MANYPSNSFKFREKDPERKKVEKVTKGDAKIRKKPTSTKFFSNFLEEDSKTVKRALLTDICIPTVKDLLLNLATSGLKMLLYGDTDVRRSAISDRRSSYTPYSSYHEKRYEDRYKEPIRSRSRSGYEYEDVLLEDLQEADEVLSRMEDLIATYGLVSVLDYYDLCGLEPKDYTCANYGWTNLREAKPTRLNSGEYIIKFPRALPID